LPKNNKKLIKDKCENYTIMIVPRRGGTTKRYNVNKKSIIKGMAFISFIIIGVLSFTVNSTTYKGKYISLNKDYNELKLQKSEVEKNNISLQQVNEYRQEQVDKLQLETDEAKDKLLALKDIENKIKVLLNDENMKVSLSRGNITANEYNDLLKSVDNEIMNLEELSEKLENEITKNLKIPSILPCNGSITSYFGYRKNPFGGYTGEFHSGLDIANSKGTKIKATADGVVIYAGVKGGYGNLVAIDHGNGYKSYYGHNSKILVNVNSKVKKGDIIAEMGSTGRSTGNHSHFEIRLYDKPINPFDIVKGEN
jgi:murein DD-endopeptidase MepM/ murein hydrolase activator NlpD